MIVKLKKLSNDAKIPTQAHDKDFCYDVYATSCREIEPGIWEYGIGLAFEIERDTLFVGGAYCDIAQTAYRPFEIPPYMYRYVKLSIDFRPRSSVWKTGMILSNCVGTIDELYRGEVLAYFYEVISGKEKYKVGDRIGQIKLGFTLPISFVEDDIDMNTERGVDGFGSTGK